MLGRVRTELTYFNTEIRDLIAYIPKTAGTPLEGADAFPVSQLPSPAAVYRQKGNQGKAKTQGVEWTLTSQVHRTLTASVNATIRRPEDQDGNRLEYTSEKAAGVGLTFKPLREWMFNWTGSYIGNRIVPPTAYSDGGAPMTWTAAQDPTLEIPSYFTANLAARYRPLRFDGLDIGLRVRNLFNETYYDAGRVVLYPRPKLTLQAWIAYRF
jgi:outer membrane cobalamin receptor